MSDSMLSKAQIKWVRSLQAKKVRDAEGVFVAEGEKCVGELRKSFELLLLVSGRNASPAAIAQMSSLRTPQGVIGVFRKPVSDGSMPSPAGLTVALDCVQDPGNLGTIIRTCDWFGVRTVCCSQDTADCYSPKVVQATMGALARVRVHYGALPAWLHACREEGLPVYGTLLDGRDIYSPSAVAQPARGVVVMGNEGNGLSAAVRGQVTHPLFIPPYPAGTETSESLNVSIATAVVLAEFRRRSR